MKFTSSYYKYLSLFRVFLAIHIIKKYVLYLPYAHEIFGSNKIVGPSEDQLLTLLNLININPVFVITLLLVFSILMLFGVGRNFSILMVYLLVEILQRMNPYLLNGGDNFMKFILLYMIFTNSFTALTLFKASKKCKTGSLYELVNNLAVLSLKIHLCVIYLISGLAKANSKVWFHGVATYYTLNLDRFSATNFNQTLTQNGLFVTLSTYTTLLWEIFFPVLVWIKKMRYYVFAIGIIMHLGIYFLMMIHDFEILFIATYGFFINDKEWKSIQEKGSKYIQKFPVLEKLIYRNA